MDLRILAYDSPIFLTDSAEPISDTTRTYVREAKGRAATPASRAATIASIASLKPNMDLRILAYDSPLFLIHSAEPISDPTRTYVRDGKARAATPSSKAATVASRASLKPNMDLRILAYDSPLFLTHSAEPISDPTRTYVRDAKARAAMPASRAATVASRASLKPNMDLRILAYDSPLFLTHSAEPIRDPTRTYVCDAKARASTAASRAAKTADYSATPADVKEHPNFYTFILDVPGLKPGDIRVQVEDDNVLVISGQRKLEEEKEGAKYLRTERRMGKFMKEFWLPEIANTDEISAICQYGVLTVTVEKLPPLGPKKPKSIEVKMA